MNHMFYSELRPSTLYRIPKDVDEPSVYILIYLHNQRFIGEYHEGIENTLVIDQYNIHQYHRIVDSLKRITSNQKYIIKKHTSGYTWSRYKYLPIKEFKNHHIQSSKKQFRCQQKHQNHRKKNTIDMRKSKKHGNTIKQHRFTCKPY